LTTCFSSCTGCFRVVEMVKKLAQHDHLGR
jgi:hypothetical protein